MGKFFFRQLFDVLALIMTSVPGKSVRSTKSVKKSKSKTLIKMRVLQVAVQKRVGLV